MARYQITVARARIQRHLMPNAPIIGKLAQGAIVEGTPFGEWLHIQHEKGSGFIRKELALELVNEESSDA